MTALYTEKRNDKIVKFHHMRNKDIDGSIIPHGGITVGWIEDEDHVVFSLAFCSMQDLYNKKFGKELVSKRLASVSFENDEIQIPLNMVQYIMAVDEDEIKEFARKLGLNRLLNEQAFALLSLQDISYSIYVLYIENFLYGED